jgi:SAM-dependent methyltransferase
VIWCPICGKRSNITAFSDNPRETGTCNSCGSFNRQRQIAHVLCTKYGVRFLGEFQELPLRIYLMETGGAFFSQLSGSKGFVCSEFYPDAVVPITAPPSACHADVQELYFEDNYFDIVISSDVFEHVPDPYKGFAELYRILKPGGVHVFTVPSGEIDDEVYALPGPIFLREPIYHLDSLREEGSLVYRYFGQAALINRLKSIGLKTIVHHLNVPEEGIVGDNAFVFESIKTF